MSQQGSHDDEGGLSIAYDQVLFYVSIFMIACCAIIALSGMCFTTSSHLCENYDLIMQIITSGL